MGASQSSSTQGCPCFAPSPFATKNNDDDLLGSPIPDTPARRSSKYHGLEKEVVPKKQKHSTAAKATGNSKHNKPKDTLDMRESEYLAQIHEGSVRIVMGETTVLVTVSSVLEGYSLWTNTPSSSPFC